jgi:GNAT superfamily N-acetyltransferase
VAELRIVESGPERIPDLEPLWRSLYEHHREIGRDVAAVRPFEETWRRRRSQYRGWLGGEDATLLIAERASRAVGYIMLTLGPGAATWDLGELLAEVETLAVLADERSGGVGAALMRAGVEWALGRGADGLMVGLAHTNDRALAFYEREGFRPFYLEMTLDLRDR